MPFPLAHPAAVLPLRRFCNRWFNFPALVIGSIAPDAGYLVRPVCNLSHEFFGSLAFGIPLGGLVFAILYVFRSKRILRPIFSSPVHPGIVGISLLVGIWSHVIWDSFTHPDGWVGMHSVLLQTPITSFGGHTARVCHLLWYASSFGGSIWLFIAFENWKRSLAESSQRSRNKVLLHGILIAALVILVSLIHHLARNPVGFGLTVVLSLIVAFQFVFRTQTEPN